MSNIQACSNHSSQKIQGNIPKRNSSCLLLNQTCRFEFLLLHERLEEVLLSRPALAELAGIDRASLRKLELGPSTARRTRLEKLVVALELPIEELSYLEQAKVRPRPRPTSKVRQILTQAEATIVATASKVAGTAGDITKLEPASAVELEGGALLVKLRLERNLTQLQLAQLCQLSRHSISRLENGDYTLKLSSIKKVAKVLEVSAPRLAPGRNFQLGLTTTIAGAEVAVTTR